MTSPHTPLAAARDRALLRTLLSGLGLPLATGFGALVALPFAARALSPTEFGVFATLTGLFALLSVVDLGVGSALTLRLSSALAAEDGDAARRAVGGSLVVAGLMAVLVAVVGTSTVRLVPWQRLLGAESLNSEVVGAGVVALSLSLALYIVGSLGSRILYGLQRGSTANAWMATATIAGGLASVAVALAEGPLYAYIVAALGVPALFGVVLTWWVSMRSARVAVRPLFRGLGLGDLTTIAGTGAWFFVIASANTVSYQVDVLIVAAVLGAPAAGVFAVVARIFGLVVQAVYPALLQLAPAFADATLRGEGDWVRRRLRSSMVLAFVLSAAGSVALALVAAPVIRVALSPELVPPLSLLVAATVWTAYSVATAPPYFLLHGLGLVCAHALMTLAVMAINVPASILLTRELGLPGPLWGSLLATVLGAGIPALVILRRRLTTRQP